MYETVGIKIYIRTQWTITSIEYLETLCVCLSYYSGPKLVDICKYFAFTHNLEMPRNIAISL